MKKAVCLYLIPADLGSDFIGHIWPAEHLSTIGHLRHFIVENERSARRFLRKAGFSVAFEEVSFFILDKHTKSEQTLRYLGPMRHGLDVGLLSEAGVPCVADPGASIVAMAHNEGYRVMPLVGPSSLILALMASGFNGQQFAFHGYLPLHQNARTNKIRMIEQQSYKLRQTQIFMETPYRNNQLLAGLLKTCAPETLLCIACNLTLPDEYIKTCSIGDWKKKIPDLHKRPGMFLLSHP